MPDTAATEAIRRTIVQYAQLMDDGRFDEWSELFTEDAEFWSVPGHHLPGAPDVARISGRAAIVDAIRRTHQAMTTDGGMIHFGGQPLIEVTGDTARAWWDFIVIRARPDGNEVSFSGRYHADLAHDNGRWRFRRRVSVRPGFDLPDGVAPTPGGPA